MSEPACRHSRGWALAAVVAVLLTAVGQAAQPARAELNAGCQSDNFEMRIRGCTELIERGGLSPYELGVAYASRALGYSMKREYETAIHDYDKALVLIPNSAMALNNRAWAYFRWGRAADGEDDVERSLRIEPTSAPAYDTRAHIRQALGQPAQALRDYRLAMTWGGAKFVRMYQCGLTAQGLYKGPLDGVENPELETALSACVRNAQCDPLPADEECRSATS